MAGYHGFFLWHELMTTDPAGARAFYPATFGWTVTPGNVPDMEYDMWTTPTGFAGGCMQLPAEAQKMGAGTHWIAYVGTSDIKGTFDNATALGARTYVPVTPIPGIGRFAVLADPQGATFAIYQPDATEDASPHAKVGDFSWHELATTDAMTSLQFYGELFGWTIVESHDMGEMGMYHLFGMNGIPLGGAFNKPDHMQGPPNWLCYVRVDDADAGAERVSDNGGRVLNGPMDVPGGDRIVQCMDPQGGAFAMHWMPNG